MKPTDELKKEHEAIKTMLKIVGRISDRLDARQKVEAGHLESIVEFIQVFADKCHHAKEENLLFPAMIAAGIPRDGSSIAVMLAEHAQGREFVRNLKASLAGYKSGKDEAARQIAKNARGYISLLGPHIDKEDFVLYPMADRAISPTRQVELLEGFEKVEEEIVGRGKHEEFHALLGKLGAIYS